MVPLGMRSRRSRVLLIPLFPSEPSRTEQWGLVCLRADKVLPMTSASSFPSSVTLVARLLDRRFLEPSLRLLSPHLQTCLSPTTSVAALTSPLAGYATAGPGGAGTSSPPGKPSSAHTAWETEALSYSQSHQTDK